MGEKEKVKEKLQNVFDELIKEIESIKEIKDENSIKFKEYFDNIIQQIDREKMDSNEILDSPLKEEDQERFVNYYSPLFEKKETFIKKCLKENNNDYQKTLDKLEKITNKKSQDYIYYIIY